MVRANGYNRTSFMQAAHATHLRFLEKVGQFESGACLAFRALQVCLGIAASDASDGSRDNGSYMVWDLSELIS